MKFLPSFKSAKALVLAAVTVATAIASNVAPSQASKPLSIIQTPGKPEIAVFDSEGSFEIACPAVRNLWSGLATKNVTPQEYQKVINSTFTIFAGPLNCNAPSIVQGYTSSAFNVGGIAGVIVVRKIPYYVKSDRFFSALGIKPTALSVPEGVKFREKNVQLINNVALDIIPGNPPSVTPTPNPRPPVPQSTSISLNNRGAYVVRYNLAYTIDGSTQKFDTGDITVGKKIVYPIPARATSISVLGEYYTGVFSQKKPLIKKIFNNPHSNLCFTSVGTVFKPEVNGNCN
jgi:hypothetical protein